MSRTRPFRFGGPAVTIDEPTQQVTSASRRRAARVEKPLAIEVIGDAPTIIA
jgi:hypothetical protein